MNKLDKWSNKYGNWPAYIYLAIIAIVMVSWAVFFVVKTFLSV